MKYVSGFNTNLNVDCMKNLTFYILTLSSKIISFDKKSE